MVQNDRWTHDEPLNRELNIRQETSGTGTVIVIVIAGIVALAVLYWLASAVWGPTTISPTVVTPAPVETVPAPAPDDTLAPMDALPPATEAPLETAPAPDATPAPAPDATPTPEPAPPPAP